MMWNKRRIYGYSAGYMEKYGTYNCVGMDAGKAGTIMSIALFVEMINGVFVGEVSDRCSLAMGRRRPFILVAATAMLPILTMGLHIIRFYDVEGDEFVYGKRHKGDVMSIISVFGTIISAVMIQIFGSLLSSFGDKKYFTCKKSFFRNELRTRGSVGIRVLAFGTFIAI